MMKDKKSFLSNKKLHNPLHSNARKMHRCFSITAGHLLVLTIIVNCDMLLADPSNSRRVGRRLFSPFQANGPIKRTIFDRHGRLSPTFSQNDISNNIGRVSPRREIKESDIHSATKPSNKEGHPYLDEEGNICQDKMEVMQHVEYDTQIHCEVKMKEHCDTHLDQEVQETIENKEFHVVDSSDIGGNENAKIDGMQEICHTMTMKKCETTYRPQMTKVKVRVCPNDINLEKESAKKMQNSIVIDVRPTPMPKFVRQAKCVNGKRAMCVTKYETMCTNKEVTHEMMEDYPRCRVEMMKKCTNTSQEESNFLFAKKENEDCQNVPAMRCKIEKRKVTKTKPETTCKRMPRQFCRKENCEDPQIASTANILDEELCYFRIQMVNEIVPQKKCKYVPKRMCHMKKKSSSQLADKTIPPQTKPVVKEILEEEEEEEEIGSRDYAGEDANDKSEDAGLPEHLRNFKEFHSLPPPSSSKFMVLNRRIKRSPSSNRKCIMVPEERCKNIRVNPKPVFKEMKRKVCRRPRPDVSAYDRQVVRRLQMWAKSISHEEDSANDDKEDEEDLSFQKFRFEHETPTHIMNDVDFHP